jgi:citrate lyase subunit beta/citryl-CoA lyase
MIHPRGGKRYRSILFVPAHKLDWILKAPKYGADALMIDLEDAVPIDQKPKGRTNTAEAIRQLKTGSFGRFVRVNGWRTGQLLRDLEAIVIGGLDGIALPKTEGPEDVAALDLVLSELELERDLPPGQIEIVPLNESAHSMWLAHEVCKASSRVRRALGVVMAVPNGDVARAINFRVSEDGREWAPFGALSALAARASGVTHILGGMTEQIGNLDLVRRIAEDSKNQGADGAFVIHPSHIPILNEVYLPSTEDIQHAREVLEAMAEAINRGDAATQLNGAMIDYAHVRSAMDVVKMAESFGIVVGPVPKIELLSY